MSGRILRERRTFTRTFWGRGEGGRAVKLQPDEQVTVELEIDIDGLFAELGHKAAQSSGGRSVEAGGLVKARRVKP